MREATILNVDDTPHSLYARSRALKTAGCTVIEAIDGHGALALAADSQPSLIILDIRLPDISGWEVTRRLKSNPRTSHIPVLQVSAELTSPGHAYVGQLSGAEAYLTGNVDGETLLNKVHAIFARLGEQAS
jgi:DNA-binding response OmpR family regulator